MLLVECPHCSVCIEIEQLNCKIFRCGILKENGNQIDPHLPKSDCDALVQKNLIFGCGKPFRVVQDASGILIAVICDYL